MLDCHVTWPAGGSCRKMAAANDKVTDVELRRQLREFGEDVGPVTDATRSLLLRKLKRLEKGGKGKRVVVEKTPPRRASPSRKPTASKSQSPSRRLIGFSSDEEDAPKSVRVSSKIRGRLSEGTTANGESTARKRKSTPRQSNRPSFGSFVDSVTEETVDSTATSSDRDEGEFSESDGPQVYSRPSNRSRFAKFMFRPVRLARHDGEERESEKEAIHSRRPLSYHKELSDESEPSFTQQERQAGAKKAKGSSWCPSLKISLSISAICIILVCVLLRRYSSENMISDHLVKLPICAENGVTANKPPDCISLKDISAKYAGWLYKRLITQAGLFDCKDPSVKSRHVTLDYLRSQIRNDNRTRPLEVQQQILNNTLELIRNNTEWKMRLLDKNNKETGVGNVTWIDTLVSAKPILCRIREAMSRLAYFSLVIGLSIGGLLFAYFVVRQRWRKEEEETRKMYLFVEKIIDILREHHEGSKTDKSLLPYLPIPHVRDMLIPPSDRQTLSKVWNRAVRFLSANESRIRVESQRIAGEDFEVWRWIHIAPPKHQSHKMSLSGTKHGKFWQGQAFENFQSAVNPPVISPTPCLKIRNMFDPDVETEEGWHVMIQDAILEKCIENGASVVHIAVDKSSSEGCVYVKCDSHHSAGLAFRSLHGCWFDGRLVAVKYLTLKRYHQRFPVALEATEHLNPSGSSPSSLVTFDPDEAEDDDDINDSDLEVA